MSKSAIPLGSDWRTSESDKSKLGWAGIAAAAPQSAPVSFANAATRSLKSPGSSAEAEEEERTVLRNEKGQVYTAEEMLKIWEGMNAENHFRSSGRARSDLYYSVMPNQPANLQSQPANANGTGRNSKEEEHRLSRQLSSMSLGGAVGNSSSSENASGNTWSPFRSPVPSAVLPSNGSSSDLGLFSPTKPTSLFGSPSVSVAATATTAAAAATTSRAYAATPPPPGIASPQPSLIAPENILWMYKDPSGKEYGPYSGRMMHDWYMSGWLQEDLMIRRTEETEFITLKSFKEKVNNSFEPFLVPLPVPLRTAGYFEPQQPQPQPQPLPPQMPQDPFARQREFLRQQQQQQQQQQPFMPQPMGWGASPWGGFSPYSPSSANTMPMMMNPQQMPSQQIDQSLWNIGQSAPPTTADVTTDVTTTATTTDVTTTDVINPDEVAIAAVTTDTTTIDTTTVDTTTIDSTVDTTVETTVETTAIDNTTDTTTDETVEPAIEEPKDKPVPKEPKRAEKSAKKSKQARAQSSSPALEAPIIAQEPAAAQVSPQAEEPKPTKPSVAPWAEKKQEKPKAPSLKEIQELEAAERKSRQAQLQQQQQAQLQAAAAAAAKSSTAPSLPSGATWGTGLSNSPATTKTLAQIQQEEAALAARAKATKTTKTTTTTTAATVAATKRYAEIGSSNTAAPASSGGAWTTVGPGGKKPTVQPQAPPHSRAVATTITSNGKRVVTNPAPTPAAQPALSSRETFLHWCKSTIQGLNAGVNQTELLSMLLSLPPTTDSREIIADTIYSNSTTMDGRRFADEFIKRRKESGVDSPSAAGTSWSDILHKTPQSDNDGWNSSFKVVTKKKKKAHN